MSLVIEEATEKDEVAVKKLLDSNRATFGFVTQAAVQQSRLKGMLRVARYNQIVVGFVRYNHRQRDSITTLYDICVTEERRGHGIGRALLDGLVVECRQRDRTMVMLKCPVDTPANKFYGHCGFVLINTQPGKKRPLNIWQYDLTLYR